MQEDLNLIHQEPWNRVCPTITVVPKWFNRIADCIAAPLCHLVNTSFVEGVFPKSLKTSTIKLVHKKGDPLKKQL
jgi:hypothetical protein